MTHEQHQEAIQAGREWAEANVSFPWWWNLERFLENVSEPRCKFPDRPRGSNTYHEGYFMAAREAAWEVVWEKKKDEEASFAM